MLMIAKMIMLRMGSVEMSNSYGVMIRVNQSSYPTPISFDSSNQDHGQLMVGKNLLHSQIFGLLFREQMSKLMTIYAYDDIMMMMTV